MMKRMKDDAVKRSTATAYLHRKAQKMNPKYNKNPNNNNDDNNNNNNNGNVGSNNLFAINYNNNIDQTKENHVNDVDVHNQDSDINNNNNNDDDDDNNDIDVLDGSVHIPCNINSQYSSVDDSSEDHDKHTDLLPKNSTADVVTNSYSHSYPLKSSLDKHNKTKNNKINNYNRSISSTTTIPMSLDKNDIINMIQSFDLSRNMEIIKINNDIMKLKASLNHDGAVASAVENNRIMKTITVIKPTHHNNDSL